MNDAGALLFAVRDKARRAEYSVGIQRYAVDAAFDEKFRKLRVVARRLPAQPDLPSEPPGVLDRLRDEPLDRRVAFVEDVRDDGRVAIHAEGQLGQVVRPDREAVKDPGELRQQHDVAWD